MEEAQRSAILGILERNRVMTVATLRDDGWPQATMVGYASEGLTLYFLCGLDSQKAHNLARDNRLSIAIGHDPDDVMTVTGLSMAARAFPVTDHQEGLHVLALLTGKYPAESNSAMVMPAPEQVRLFRVAPEVISILDYTKGFAHTELVTC